MTQNILQQGMEDPGPSKSFCKYLPLHGVFKNLGVGIKIRLRDVLESGAIHGYIDVREG